MSAESKQYSTKNNILTALPNEDYQRLAPHFENMSLDTGVVITEAGDLITHLYFPDNAMISVIICTPDGECAEAGVVGREGLTGISALFGVDRTPHQNTLQLPGNVTRINVDIVRQEFKKGGAFHDLVLRYMNALMMQISQTALCNRLHQVEQRLARWLLMSHDRSESDELKITQDFLAVMLGVHRPAVSISATMLQNAGFIRYRRGTITMLNRPGLEEFVCECYGFVKAEIDRLPK